MKKPEKVQWQDVQGLVLSGYPLLPFAAYIPWRFVGTDLGQKAWLRDLMGRLMRVVDQREPDRTSGQPLRPTSLKTMKMHRESGAVDVWVVNVALARDWSEKAWSRRRRALAIFRRISRRHGA